VEFPRKLNEKEKELLFSLLPENREGYGAYREKLSEYYAIGFGRFGNLIMGEREDNVDLTIPPSPVFAIGSVKTNLGEVYIVIHEEFENQIEIDLSDTEFLEAEDFQILSGWTYSVWKPGMRNPANKEKVREVRIVKNQLVVAVSVSDKKIWVYDGLSGVNHFIPVTKFYDELMRIKGERDPAVALNASRFFVHANEFSDELIARTFIIYNKYAKKIDFEPANYEVRKKRKKSFLKLFKRG